MIGVKATKILGVLSQVFQINGRIVTGDESLKFRRREHGQPVGIDDGAESANERTRLLVNLCVHSKVRH